MVLAWHHIRLQSSEGLMGGRILSVAPSQGCKMVLAVGRKLHILAHYINTSWTLFLYQHL